MQIQSLMSHWDQSKCIHIKFNSLSLKKNVTDKAFGFFAKKLMY